MKNDSACKRPYKLCAFSPSRDLEDAAIEVCTQCSKKVIYKKHDGQIDNQKYLRDHIRDFAQPFGRTGKIFQEIYGKEAYKKAIEYRQMYRNIKSKDKIQEEWEQAHKDAKRDLRQRDDYGKKMIFT